MITTTVDRRTFLQLVAGTSAALLLATHDVLPFT